MSRYGHMVKFNGKYYNPWEEVPDGIQSRRPTGENGTEPKHETAAEKQEAKKVPNERCKTPEQVAYAVSRPSMKK